MTVKDGTNVPHGTKNGYSGYGCRCEPCREAARDYQREYLRRKRIREGKQGVEHAGAAVVDIRRKNRGIPVAPTVDKNETVVPQGNSKRVIGECEEAVLKETSMLSEHDARPGMVMAAVKMARILDNDGLVSLHPTTSRQLTQILDTLKASSRGKRKGRLAAVQNMSRRASSQ